MLSRESSVSFNKQLSDTPHMVPTWYHDVGSQNKDPFKASKEIFQKF